MFDSKKEVPLDTVNLSDLILQFKLMKAMGFKSLFDPEFRRELKNPYRKQLYYKILVSEELIDRKILFNYMEDISDKLAFFSDPELYNKFRDREKKLKVESGQQDEASENVRRRHQDVVAGHKVSIQEQRDVRNLLHGLNQSRATRRSMMNMR